jgi:hypothetical protein
MEDVDTNALLKDDNLFDNKKVVSATISATGRKLIGYWDTKSAASEDEVKGIKSIVGDKPKENWMAMYQDNLYLYADGAWRRVTFPAPISKNMHKIMSGWTDIGYQNGLTGYETGGLADFTGPAWLDGTPSKPEYILNSAQTERFFSLVDVLERFDSDAKSQKSSGDNYFDIEINVEKLENDYDVEQVADKIRRMICDDAAYRNVNTINHIR